MCGDVIVPDGHLEVLLPGLLPLHCSVPVEWFNQSYHLHRRRHSIASIVRIVLNLSSTLQFAGLPDSLRRIG